MKNKRTALLMFILVFTGLFGGVALPAHAQTITPPADGSVLTASPDTDPTDVTWQMLNISETTLTGPYDSFYFAIGLPADWKIASGARLVLNKAIAVSTGITLAATPGVTGAANTTVGGGTLTITFNNTTLAVLPLSSLGESQQVVDIPISAFATNRTDGRHVIGFILNAGFSCNTFEQVSVILRNTSFFKLPHETVDPVTDLVNFPRPIFMNSFVPDSALLVLPDAPTVAELQSALSVSAGLGNLTNASTQFSLDMTTLGKLTAEQKAANHIIFVGNASSVEKLGALNLPLPLSGGKFDFTGEDPRTVGSVQMVVSPWSRSHVVMVVSGNEDEGTIKAGQAVSSGVFRANTSPNLALVQSVDAQIVQPALPTDVTLADLGYEAHLFENRGISTTSYNFYIPPGWMLDANASFEMIYGHSALLAYERSGITVLVNGKPVGSARLSEATAANATNSLLINLPASAVISGVNRLDIRANLIPHDDCTPPNMRGMWINIWPESKLHLPIIKAAVNPIPLMGLASYPAPFSFYSMLENTAFVLPKNDVESWKSALKIANYLGGVTGGTLYAPVAYFGDAMPEQERSKYNIIIIGQPKQLSIVSELRDSMPVPFAADSNTSQNEKFQVTYIISPDSPMGYVEMFASPWNAENVVLAVLGNSSNGLGWASNSIIDTTLRSKLAGNFAVINGTQVLTSDTQINPTINSGTGLQVVIATATGTPDQTANVVERPAWIYPAFGVLLFFILAIIVLKVWSGARRRK